MSCHHAAFRRNQIWLQPMSLCLLHPHGISRPGTKGPWEWSNHVRTGKKQWKMHQVITPLPISPPAQVVLWILGLPNVVWEDLESFLPDPQEAKNGSCLRPFLSLGLFTKDFWVDERDCGLWAVKGEGLSFQISGKAQRFKLSKFHIRCLSSLGIQALPPKNVQNIHCFCCLGSGSLIVFPKQVSAPVRLVWKSEI